MNEGTQNRYLQVRDYLESEQRVNSQLEAELTALREQLDNAESRVAGQICRAEAAEAVVAATKAIEERALNDDLNVLWNRCEDQEPLSIAEQRELYLWWQEKDAATGDLNEKVELLNAIVEPLEALLFAPNAPGTVWRRRVNLSRCERGYTVAVPGRTAVDATLPEALAAAVKAEGETDA